MAQINITIPDGKLQEAVLRFSNELGYNDNILDIDGNLIPNPESRGQYSQRMIVRHVKRVIDSNIKREKRLVSDQEASGDTDALGIS
jgi:hypothetical protein